MHIIRFQCHCSFGAQLDLALARNESASSLLAVGAELGAVDADALAESMMLHSQRSDFRFEWLPSVGRSVGDGGGVASSLPSLRTNDQSGPEMGESAT